MRRWGEPRETVDVDLPLLTGFGREREFVSVLMRSFQPGVDDAEAFAAANRVADLFGEGPDRAQGVRRSPRDWMDVDGAVTPLP